MQQPIEAATKTPINNSNSYSNSNRKHSDEQEIVEASPGRQQQQQQQATAQTTSQPSSFPQKSERDSSVSTATATSTVSVTNTASLPAAVPPPITPRATATTTTITSTGYPSSMQPDTPQQPLATITQFDANASPTTNSNSNSITNSNTTNRTPIRSTSSSKPVNSPYIQKQRSVKRGSSWKSFRGRLNSDQTTNRSNRSIRSNHNEIPAPASSTTTTTMPSTSPTSSMQNASFQPDQGRVPRRKSVLNASRKVINTTVGRPLRAVGRAVSGNRKRTGSSEEIDILTAAANATYNQVATPKSANTTVPFAAPAPSNDAVNNNNSSIPAPSSSSSSSLVDANMAVMAPVDLQSSFQNAPGSHPDATAAANVARGINNRHINTAQDTDRTVNTVEAALRQVVLLCGAFLLGSFRPDYADTVYKAFEYALIAWATCIVIISSEWLQTRFKPKAAATAPSAAPRSLIIPTNISVVSDNHDPDNSSHMNSDAETAADRDFGDDVFDEPPTIADDVVNLPSTVNIIATSNDEAPTSIEQQVEVPSPASTTATATTTQRSQPETTTTTTTKTPEPEPLAHPSLAPFYIMDGYTGTRIYPNAPKPIHISNEFFDMEMVVIIRTPDVDNPKVPRGTASNDLMATYLRDRQRRFEFQYQMTIKKVPANKTFYFACELDEPIKMGLIQRAFVGASMAFMKSTNPTFHYSTMGSGNKKSTEGKYEKPHMSFTVEGSLDRLIVTKPGEKPPQLGTEIHESAESIKKRKKGGSVVWNTTDTYTMALWSAYVDFLDWKVLNLPGIRPFLLSSVLGNQAIVLSFYMIDEAKANEKHYRKDITEVINLELCNTGKSGISGLAKKWIAKQKSGTATKKPVAKEDSPQPEKKLPPIVADDDGSDEDENGVMLREVLAAQPKPTTPDATSKPEIDEENEDDDAATAAELGQGLYLQSGDKIVLKQFFDQPETMGDNASNYSIANGAGFAILQNQNDCIVTIEKARKSSRNKLIKTGDTVLFKVIQKRHSGYETRFLTIHRGWWLKWVTRLPKKNGYFTICNVDKDSTESSSYVSIGGAFKLKHKRWSSYYVGAAAEPSPTYGGRLLALYNPNATKSSTSDADEEYDTDEGDAGELEEPIVSRGDHTWMKPLILYADDAASVGMSNNNASQRDILPKQIGGTDSNTTRVPDSLLFSKDHSRIDVPAWIEMMNRTERIRQLTYVVRVVHQEEQSDVPENQNAIGPATFARLRTGRELAPLMRFGLTHRSISGPNLSRDNSRPEVGKMSTSFHNKEKPKPLSTRATSIDGTPLSPEKEVALNLSPRNLRSVDHGFSRNVSFGDDSIGYDDGDIMEEDSIVSAEELSRELQEQMSQELEWADGMSQDEDSDRDLESEPESEPEPEPEVETEPEPENDNSKHGGSGRSKSRSIKKGKTLIGKVAMKAKNVTVATGKTAGKVVVGTGKLTGKAVVGTAKLTGKGVVGTMKQSKKVVRGSVSAGKATGKAVIAPITRKSKKIPKQEPRVKTVSKESKRQTQDKHVEVFKDMKKIGKDQLKMTAETSAGELCAPEKSCRIASSVLSRMSNLDPKAPMWTQFNAVLKKQLSIDTDQDRWFLQGNHVEVGVSPVPRGEKLHDSLVARCLWESHWREEWCGVYKSCVSFYAPLSKSPCLEISYIDITNVRPLDAAESSPLPGFPLLVLETAWLCHYVAFRDEEARDTFGKRVEGAIAIHVKEVEESAALSERDLRKARFWQGFQSLSEAAISPGRGKWAKIVSNQKSKERAILNSRRMVFDLNSTTSFGAVANGYELVEKLLATALSFSLKTLENDPESFVQFLDATSHLRLLPLHQMDFSSKAAFCLFVNLYHVILQHAMLLSINGPLHKRSVGHFMRTSCYEVGGDIFSLAELHCCVLRGKLNKPFVTKPPYIEPTKKSLAAYRTYSLSYRDPRLVFCVNTGDFSCLRTVPVLCEENVEEQLKESAIVFLKNQLVVDTARRLIILPKVCDVYRQDFGNGDSMSCLRVCMAILKDEPIAESIRSIFHDDLLQVRYRHTVEQYHTSLKLRKEEAEV